MEAKKYYPYNKGYFMIPRTLMYDPFWLALKPKHQALGIMLTGRANHTDGIWMLGARPIPIRRGQLVSSLPSIQKMMGDTTERKARLALDALKAINFITWESTPTHRIITIINYDAIQNPDSYKGNGRPFTVGDDEINGRPTSDLSPKKWQTPIPSGESASKGRPKLEKTSGIQESNSKENDGMPCSDKEPSSQSSIEDHAINTKEKLPQDVAISKATVKGNELNPPIKHPRQTPLTPDKVKALIAGFKAEYGVEPSADDIESLKQFYIDALKQGELAGVAQ